MPSYDLVSGSKIASMNTPMKPALLPQLTGLRFIAAFAVVLCHFAGHYFPFLPEPVRQIMGGMFNAVSLFFALSGFILAHTYGRTLPEGKTTSAKFLFARVARIYPMFLMSLAIDIPIFLINNRDQITLGAIPRFIQKILLLQTWTPAPFDITIRWNAPSWSLSTEAFFYLTFPFLIKPISKLSGRSSWTWLLATLAIATGFSVWYDFSLAAAFPTTTPLGEAIKQLFIQAPYIRVIEFIAGIFLYNIYRDYGTWMKEKFSRVSWNAALIVVLALYALLNFKGREVMMSQGLSTALFSVLILGLALEAFSITNWLGNKTFVKLGEASYSLYLIHFPVFHTGEFIIRKVHILDLNRATLNPVFGIVLGVASIWLSILCHKFVEIPARKVLMDWWATNHVKQAN